MAKHTATFPMDYGKVLDKSRCGLVSGTILNSPTLGEIFIGCKSLEKLAAAFKRLAPRNTVYNPELRQELAVFRQIDVIHGDEAREPLPASHWEKMDTAPTDGREVILMVESRAGIPHKCLVGHYMEGGHCIEDHPPISEGWYFWNGCSFDRAAKPIRWMPLPEQPTDLEG